MSTFHGRNCQNMVISLRPGKKGLWARLQVITTPVTPVNAPFVHEGIIMQNSLGRPFKSNLGSMDYITLDYKKIKSHKQGNWNLEEILSNKYYLVKIGKKWEVVTEVKQTDLCDNGVTVATGKTEYWKLTNGRSRVFWKKDWEYIPFGGSCDINSTSQGRQANITLFRLDKKEEFYRNLDHVTNGEYGLSVGRKMSISEMVDTNTRISSKTTRLHIGKDSGVFVDNYIVAVTKADDYDGAFVLSKEAVDDMFIRMGANPTNGYVDLQSRPYTGKGNGRTISRGMMNDYVSQFNIHKLDLNSDEEINAFAAITNKGMRSKYNIKVGDFGPSKMPLHLGGEGVNAIWVCHDPNGKLADCQMVIDINSLKDRYNPRELDGLNILAEDHDCKAYGANTFQQFWKVAMWAAKQSDQWDLFEDTAKRIIDRDINKMVSFKKSIRIDGTEMFDVQHIGTTISQLAGPEIKKFPQLFRAVLDSLAESFGNAVGRDAWSVAGHSLFLNADLVKQIYGFATIDIGDGYIESVVPSFWNYSHRNKITDNRGFIMKTPSMGATEGMKTVFLSKDEYLERTTIRAMEHGCSDSEIANIRDMIMNLADGVIMVPANIKIISSILAGLDYDGDHAIVLFPDPGYDFNDIFWHESFKNRAVNIIPPDDKTNLEVTYGPGAFISALAKIEGFENPSIGAITYCFAIFTQGLLLADDDMEGWDFFVNLFSGECFEMGKWGKDEYVSPIEVRELVDGVAKYTEYTVASETMNEIMNRIKNSAVNIENIKKILWDMDVLGRYCQEVAIDSAKKFYPVVIPFIDVVLSSFAIVDTLRVVDFKMHLNQNEWTVYGEDGKVMVNEDGNTVLEDPGMELNSEVFGIVEDAVTDSINPDNEVFVLKGAFNSVRKYAVQRIFDELQKLRQDYIDSLAIDNDDKQRFLNLVQQIGGPVKFARFWNVISMVNVANGIYSSYQEYIRLNSDMDKMNDVDAATADRDLRSEANRKFSDLLACIDNELRKLGVEFGLEPQELAILATGGKFVGSVGMGKVLNAEVAAMICDNLTESNAVSFAIHSANEDVLNFIKTKKKVYIKDGMVYAMVNGNVTVLDAWVKDNLLEGAWLVGIKNDKPVVVRKVSEFITIPEADMDKTCFRISFEADADVDKRLELLKSATSLCIREDFDERGYKNLYLKDAENGYTIGMVMAGQVREVETMGIKFSKGMNEIKPTLLNIVGNLETFEVYGKRDSVNFEDAPITNAIVCLNSVVQEEAPAVEISEHTQAILSGAISLSFGDFSL